MVDYNQVFTPSGNGPAAPLRKGRECVPFKIMSTIQHDRSTLADASAAISVSSVGFAWAAQVNDILTMTATVVAIVAGLYAIKHHRAKIKLLRELSEDYERDRSQRDNVKSVADRTEVVD